jgi:hypothetical protein
VTGLPITAATAAETMCNIKARSLGYDEERALEVEHNEWLAE